MLSVMSQRAVGRQRLAQGLLGVEAVRGLWTKAKGDNGNIGGMVRQAQPRDPEAAVRPLSGWIVLLPLKCLLDVSEAVGKAVLWRSALGGGGGIKRGRRRGGGREWGGGGGGEGPVFRGTLKMSLLHT